MGRGLHSREGLEHSGRADLGCPGQAGRPQSGWPRVQGTEVKVEVRNSRYLVPGCAEGLSDPLGQEMQGKKTPPCSVWLFPTGHLTMLCNVVIYGLPTGQRPLHPVACSAGTSHSIPTPLGRE